MCQLHNNPSFVLKGIEDVVYEERPIPEGEIEDPRSDRPAHSPVFQLLAMKS